MLECPFSPFKLQTRRATDNKPLTCRLTIYAPITANGMLSNSQIVGVSRCAIFGSAVC
jgi:hypothetical protein